MSSAVAPTEVIEADTIVVGAGVTGIYQLYRLREQGHNARLLEAGSGVGGTWYWNRYPGARFDSESYTYGYFFSEELLDEWTWSEEFASQPETERYLNFVVDKFALREFIDFDARVRSAVWNAANSVWEVETEQGVRYRAQFLITALGILSAPQFPSAPGIGTYQGEAYHTGVWPDRDIDFTGKRVAVIGTGSSGVQIVPFVAETAAQLTVFQRTPNWCTPINNKPIDAKRAAELRLSMSEIYRATQESAAGGMYRTEPGALLDLTPEEQRAHLDRLYGAPGLSMVLANFRDVAINAEANAVVTDYLADRIRTRVNDPSVAAKLIPTDHHYGQKRPPLENGYYEAFNRHNVSLISTEEEPIERFTETGLRTASGDYTFDMIVFATGFDSVVGSYNLIDIVGTTRSLKEHWANGPRTHLGIQSAGFPNLFMVGGAQSTTGNIPRATEPQVDWVMRLINWMQEQGAASVDTTVSAEDEWIDHVHSGLVGSLLEKAESWAFGSNVPGSARAYRLYAGGLPLYREKISEVEQNDYRGFTFTSK
ncbi:flavin-containing monooxygenase [Mycobacterium sp. 48b]|uniref:flavin-containing monooxygenase n=1 Tax=Mycobacterium sp. 48b TaxID=3400426 RepID=UPI003AB0D911